MKLNSMTRFTGACHLALVTAGALHLGTAMAGDRLIGTAGVSQIEGAGGGGLTPWALITGYGTRDQIGASAFTTRLRTRGGFTLTAAGLAVGIQNRVEFSLATQRFGLSDTVPGETIGLDIVGAKVRLFGDAVYDQDSLLPQVALGVQWKRNNDFDRVPKLLGASSANGMDFYLSATKVWLAGLAGRNPFLNVTVRNSSANQFGLLGFGGPNGDSRRLHPELSAGLFVADSVALGVEYRAKSNNLTSFKEEAAKDVFAAWFLNKNLSLTAAYVDLGNIADKPKQTGWYVSAQLAL